MPEIYLDTCKVGNHYGTHAVMQQSFPLSAVTSKLFAVRSFYVRPSGSIHVHKAVGTNGAFLERAEYGEMQNVGKNCSNQLTVDEKARLATTCTGRNPWSIQKDLFIKRYIALAGEIQDAVGNLHFYQPKIFECEYYVEYPMFRQDKHFDEDFTKILCTLFGEAEIEKNRSAKSYEDGDYRRWRLKTPLGLNNKTKVYLKLYQKNDLIRIEVRFEHAKCFNLRLPARGHEGMARVGNVLDATIDSLGAYAEEILKVVHESMLGNLPSYDIGLFRKVLREGYRLRGVEWNKKYDQLCEALDLKGSYTPSRMNGLAILPRTLGILSDENNGVLQKIAKSPESHVFRDFYILRPDWMKRAERLLAANGLAKPIDPSLGK